MNRTWPKSTRTVTFISHVNPVSPAAGNEIRIRKMIEWFRSEGVRIVLLLNRAPLSFDMRCRLLKVVDAVHTPDEFPASLPNRIAHKMARWLLPQDVPITEAEKVRAFLGSHRLVQATGMLCKQYRPQAVIAEYAFAAPCLRGIPPGTLRMVDTHDLLSKRDPNEPIYCSPGEEREYLLNADVIISIQKNETEEFRTLVPERRVVTVGVDFEVAEIGGPEELQKNTVLVVGSNNPNNLSGLKAFYEHAWPIVCKANPRAELWVAGKIGEAISADAGRVRVLGWVEDLRALYRQTAIVINPILNGTGLKIKTVEALCHRKPLVATPNAVEGFDFQEEIPCLVRDNWSDFAEAILSLLASDELREKLGMYATRYAQEYFSTSRTYAQLYDVLGYRTG